MANLHVAFASPNARYVEYALAPNNIREELLTEPLKLVDGMLEAPTAPGLGVALRPETIAAYPFRPGNIEYA
jgi:L-alanine-DL-glutamate epimerase-like enolase superfamily enzyme